MKKKCQELQDLEQLLEFFQELQRVLQNPNFNPEVEGEDLRRSVKIHEGLVAEAKARVEAKPYLKAEIMRRLFSSPEWASDVIMAGTKILNQIL